MRVWLVFVNKQVRYVCKNASVATKHLENLKKVNGDQTDAWCMEFTVMEE